MKKISKKRKEMGEEAWAEYQKQRNVKKIVNYRKNLKKKMIALKGGKCIKCGYNKDVLAAFCFHHREPSLKKFGLTVRSFHRPRKEIFKELEKCDLLCVRCHAELHHSKNGNC